MSYEDGKPDNKRFRGDSCDLDGEQAKMENLTSVEFHRLLNEIADIKAGQVASRESLEKKIDTLAKELCVEINQNIEEKIQSFRDEFKAEFRKYDKRMCDLESNLHKLGERIHTRENPIQREELCIVAIWLYYETNEDLPCKVDHLLRNIGVVNGRDVKVIATERLPTRYAKQIPLVKIAVENTEQKIKILRARSKLATSNEFKRVRIWGSKSHAERLIESNFNTLLGAMPELKSNFRITNHGKVVPIQGADSSSMNNHENAVVQGQDRNSVSKPSTRVPPPRNNLENPFQLSRDNQMTKRTTTPLTDATGPSARSTSKISHQVETDASFRRPHHGEFQGRTSSYAADKNVQPRLLDPQHDSASQQTQPYTSLPMTKFVKEW